MKHFSVVLCGSQCFLKKFIKEVLEANTAIIINTAHWPSDDVCQLNISSITDITSEQLHAQLSDSSLVDNMHVQAACCAARA